MLAGKIIKNTLSQGAGKGFALAFSLATTAILTRHLGVSGFGVYTFATVFVVFAAAMSDWGTNLIGVREAVKKGVDKNDFFSSLALIRILFATTALLVVNLVVRLNPVWDDKIIPVTIASIAIWFLSLRVSFAMIFHAILRLEFSALMEIVYSVSFFLLASALVLKAVDVNTILGAWVLATGLAALSGYLIVRKFIQLKKTIKWKTIAPVLKESIPMGALLLVFSIYNRVDTLILEHFHGSSAVGIYGLSYRVYENLVLGAAYFMNTLLPVFSAASLQNPKKIYSLFQKAFDVLVIFGMAIALLFFFFAPFVINLLGGGEFQASIPLLRVLLVALLITYLNHLTGYSLVAFRKQKASLYIAVVALTLNVVLNLMFIPKFSFYAAAWITVATEGFVFLATMLVVKRTINYLPTLANTPRTLYDIFRGKYRDLF